MKKEEFPKIKGKLILAPMAGVTNVAFRILCKKLGAGICYTEFFHTDALQKGNVFDVVKEERPVVTQIFGNDENKLYEAAKSLVGKTDVVDLNIGCPAPKVIGLGSGAALLKDLKKVESILKKLSTLNIPISCKIRLGVNEKNIVALELAKIADKYCCAIAVHARTLEQGYSGKADWSYIKKIKESVSISVIGNGDIDKVEDVKRMIDQTGCDYVMVGRRAMKDPFFFRRVNHYLKTGIILPEESFEEKMKLLLEYLKLCKKYDCFEVNNFKFLFVQFSRGYKNSSKLRVEVSKIKNVEELLHKIKELC
ncbi:tRNA-dihydrouridine synthase family protein [Candidatus Woesearchaeota archaeon]|nr:tRNA-dihydrouridine synthase family protein [Candidatus Woesearchaeota archaeon]